MISPRWQLPGPARFDPPNLLESTLRPALGTPFLQSDWPLPKSAAYPNDNRSFLRAAQTQLIGKDVFFGPAGMPPDFDWPLPQAAVYPNDNRSWMRGAQIQLSGKDVFFGGAGKAPSFDWPLPRPAAYPNDNRTWNRAAQTQLIGKDVFFGGAGKAPEYDWPLPRTPFQPLQSWTSSWEPLLVAPTGPAPFSQRDWPLPKASPPQVDLKTWLNPLDIFLLGKDTFFGAPGQPPANMDWPLPKAATYPVDNRTWIRSYNWAQLGADRFFAAPGQAPVFDWSLPKSVPAQSRGFTWSQQIAPAPAVVPFNQGDWSLPRSPSQANLSWSRSAQIAPPLAVPFSQSDWPNPRGAVQSRGFTWSQQLVPVAMPFSQLDWPNPRGAIVPATLRNFAAWQQLVPPATIFADRRIVYIPARSFSEAGGAIGDRSVTYGGRNFTVKMN